MNVTINNTDKTGFLHIHMNDYYPSTIDEKEHWCRIDDDFAGLCVRYINGADVIELHIGHEEKSFYLVYAAQAGSLIVDSINGVAPTSLNDLRDKILALIP